MNFDKVTRSIERTTVGVGILASLALVPLVLATCYEVVSRYAFNAPTVWAYEVGYLLTGTHFLLGMAYTLQTGDHIRIDVFSGRFSQRTRTWIDLVGYALTLPLLTWLSVTLAAYFLTGYVRDEHSGQSAMNLPVWPFRLVFVVAFALLALQVIAEIIKSVRSLRQPSLR